MPNLNFIKYNDEKMEVLYPNYDPIGTSTIAELMTHVSITKTQAKKLDLLMSGKIETIALRIKTNQGANYIYYISKLKGDC